MRHVFATAAASVLTATTVFAQSPDVGRQRVAPALMALSGLAVAGLWSADLISGEKVDTSEGWLRVRDRETGQILLPHLIAEYGTAAALLASSYGLATDRAWGRGLALLGIGALAYTSINSVGWTLSAESRLAYAIPMLLSLAGAGVSVAIVF